MLSITLICHFFQFPTIACETCKWNENIAEQPVQLVFQPNSGNLLKPSNIDVPIIELPESFEAPNATIQPVEQASVQFQNNLDHDTSSPSSKPTPKRKRKPNSNINDEVSAEETSTGESDVYTFIDDEPVSKKKRSTVR